MIHGQLAGEFGVSVQGRVENRAMLGVDVTRDRPLGQGDAAITFGLLERPKGIRV